MQNILRTNDPVLLSFVAALLSEAGIGHHVADTHISVLEGSIGAFPRRVMVADDAVAEARRLLRDAGLAAELIPEPVAGEGLAAVPGGRQRPIPDGSQ